MDNPWKNFRLGAQYILPDDLEPCLPFIGNRCRPEHALRLELLPQPFIGSPRAPVILLCLNPGYSETDEGDFRQPLLRELLLRCIQEMPTDYPFYYLHPQCVGSGTSWWLKRLRVLIETLDAGEGERRMKLASSICAHEFFPYHSRRFAHGRLRSVSLPYQLICIREAMASGAVIVGMRSKRLWESVLPELKGYSRVFWCSNPQQPYLTPGSLGAGFDVLLEVLGQCVS